MKDHKWYCPYKAPQDTCTERGVTHQQQQTQLLGGGAGQAGDGQAVGLSAMPSVFPCMRELLQETDHIMDKDLFRAINECLRPKVTGC